VSGATGEYPVNRNYPDDGTIPTKIKRNKFPKLAIDLFRIGLEWKKY